MAGTQATDLSEAPAAAGRRPLFFYGYWILVAAFVAQFVAVGTQSHVAGVFFKPMTEELGWTRTEFTYAQTVGRFVMAFVGFFIGVYVDRFGGRVIMLVGGAILAIALFAASTVTELWQWLVLRGVIDTIGVAMIGNLVVNVTLSKWFVEKRGRAVGIAAAGISLSGMVTAPVLTLFIEEFGWRTGWRALAVVSALLVYPVALLMRRQPEDYGLHPDGKSDAEVAAGQAARAQADYDNSFTRRQALRTRAFYLIVLAFGLGGVGIGTILLQTIPYLTGQGFSPTTAALMLSAYALPSFLSKPFWGLLIERSETKYLAAVSFVMEGAAVMAVVVGATAGSVPLVMLAYLAFGLGVGGNIPLQEVIWASYFGRRYLGAVRSVALPFSLALGAGGPLLVSYYFDVVGNYHGAFLVVGALSVLGGLLVLLVRSSGVPQRPAEPSPPREEGARVDVPPATA